LRALQGDLDAVVPPNQAELMHAKLKARGLPTALVIYKGALSIHHEFGISKL
jgi:dipeptidyl aminopeptidase/acylaminoacyl peptidase